MSACLDAFATTLGRLQRRLSCTRCRWNSRRSPCCFWLRGCRRAGKGWFRAYRTLTISDAISGSAPRPSGTGGLQTLCWGEMDSNPRSPVRRTTLSRLLFPNMEDRRDRLSAEIQTTDAAYLFISANQSACASSKMAMASYSTP